LVPASALVSIRVDFVLVFVVSIHMDFVLVFVVVWFFAPTMFLKHHHSFSNPELKKTTP
jgi:hypothetical protein